MKYLSLISLLLSLNGMAETTATWKTSKRMFLVSNQEAVGISTQVTVKTGSEENRFIELIIPISSFKSGEPDRDKEVLNILKADVQSDLIFKTAPMNSAEFQQIIEGLVNEVAGKLKIANKEYDISVKLEVSNNFLTGTFEGTFTQFDIEPPTVAGGVVAKVNDELTLVGRVDLKDLK